MGRQAQTISSRMRNRTTVHVVVVVVVLPGGTIAFHRYPFRCRLKCPPIPSFRGGTGAPFHRVRYAKLLCHELLTGDGMDADRLQDLIDFPEILRFRTAITITTPHPVQQPASRFPVLCARRVKVCSGLIDRNQIRAGTVSQPY